jgi:hypothetical protein
VISWLPSFAVKHGVIPGTLVGNVTDVTPSLLLRLPPEDLSSHDVVAVRHATSGDCQDPEVTVGVADANVVTPNGDLRQIFMGKCATERVVMSNGDN